MSKKKNKKMNPAQLEAIRTKDFFDCILPGAVRFMSDYYIVGDSYRSVWVVQEYPPSTEEQAILSQLADRSGVTLRIYHRLVEPMEQRKILQNATRKNKLMSGGNDCQQEINCANAQLTLYHRSPRQPPGCGGAAGKPTEEQGTLAPLFCLY